MTVDKMVEGNGYRLGWHDSTHEMTTMRMHASHLQMRQGQPIGRLYFLSRHGKWVNASRPRGKPQFAPLHQAAYTGAPVDIGDRLIQMGVFRTLQNVRGERPLDVAEQKCHHQLREIWKPQLKHSIPIGILLKIQSSFHEVIRDRIDRALPNHELWLPEWEPLLEPDRPQMWFSVPGMYGGFRSHLESAGVDAKLASESWSKIVGGLGNVMRQQLREARLSKKLLSNSWVASSAKRNTLRVVGWAACPEGGLARNPPFWNSPHGRPERTRARTTAWLCRSSRAA
jgi:hypothetical protein